MIILVGPTASGKTSLAESLVRKYNCEIINADVVQMYSKVSVGTAKPENSLDRGWLFDQIDQTKNTSASEFRKLVQQKIHEILNRNKMPLITGGSFFYVKNLLFSWSGFESMEKDEFVEVSLIDLNDQLLTTDFLYKNLKKFDPVRASMLGENDRYRIIRALEIMQQTKSKASAFKEIFDPIYPNINILALTPPINVLTERIILRAEQMLSPNGGWIKEAEMLLRNENIEWRTFIERKNFIGYKALISWLSDKKNHATVFYERESLEKIKKSIIIETRNYAKRQICFWKKLKKNVLETKQVKVVEFASLPSVDEVINRLRTN